MSNVKSIAVGTNDLKRFIGEFKNRTIKITKQATALYAGRPGVLPQMRTSLRAAFAAARAVNPSWVARAA